MEALKDVNKTGRCLMICEQSEKQLHQHLAKHFENLIYVNATHLTNEDNESAELIYCKGDLSDDVLNNSLKVLKPGGKLLVEKVSDPNKFKFQLITKGFMNITINEDTMRADKPKFAMGSMAKLNIQKKSAPAVWKLDEDEDTIDPDMLLDEEDLKKPDPSTLRVCGTTGKRKACKDCSCGLADELELEANMGKLMDTHDTPKSSCGSCYLGDAFRCATCPYLGMPAFKPGEKIQLVGNQLEADL